MKKKWIIPLIAIGSFIAGSVFIMIPFLPFGWLLYFMTAILLSPYFKPIERLLKWLVDIDKTGTFQKAKYKVAQLYQWAGDHERAEKLIKDENDNADKK